MYWDIALQQKVFSRFVNTFIICVSALLGIDSLYFQNLKEIWAKKNCKEFTKYECI
jgi:hypothetical protein